MKTLLVNEWTKIRRERALWFALALHLAPLAMVVTAALMGVHDGPSQQRYFILHNQSVIVTGIVSVVVTSAAFHVEISNRTWFEWLMLPVKRTRLLAAKMVVAFALQVAFVVLSAIGASLFLLASGADELPRSIAAYLMLQLGTMVVMSAIGALLCLTLQNILIVNIVGVGSSLVTMVVMAADFSWAVPTAWPYRAGLMILDASDYAFENWWALPAGGAVLAGCVLVAAVGSVIAVQSPRVLDAARN